MRAPIPDHELTFKILPSGVPGTHCCVALWENATSPIGIVWFRYAADDAIELLQSFVKVTCRRKGVRTAIHKYLLKSHDTPKYKCWHFMRTSAGNRQSTPWLKKLGFKYRKDRNCWELRFQ